MEKSKVGSSPSLLRKYYDLMIDAKVMLEEYYGYDTVKGHYEGDNWIETFREHHNGIITNLANEAQRIRDRSNLGRRFMDRTFANFDKRRDPIAFNACNVYANRENLFSEKKNSLLIFGAVGSGKTHLCAAIANDFASKSIPTLFGTYIDHLEHIRSEFESAGANAYLTDMKTMMVLVIDDLGKEKKTDWSQQILFDVINYRYEHMLPVIITTNFNASGLANYVGHPIWSRLYEMSSAVDTQGGDHRMED